MRSIEEGFRCYIVELITSSRLDRAKEMHDEEEPINPLVTKRIPRKVVPEILVAKYWALYSIAGSVNIPKAPDSLSRSTIHVVLRFV